MAASAARLPASVAMYLAMAPSVLSAPFSPSPASIRRGGVLDVGARGLEPDGVRHDELVRVALLGRQGRAAPGCGWSSTGSRGRARTSRRRGRRTRPSGACSRRPSAPARGPVLRRRQSGSSAGTKTLSRNSAAVLDSRMPCLSSGLAWSKPSVSRSRTNQDGPPGAEGQDGVLVRDPAVADPLLAAVEPVALDLPPSMTGVAVVLSAPRSLPASGSVAPYAYRIPCSAISREPGCVSGRVWRRSISGHCQGTWRARWWRGRGRCGAMCSHTR